jgi:hypothetical protein
MYSPRIKTLENCANAAGGAFGCMEEDFEPRYVALPSRAKKLTIVGILTGACAVIAGHHFGLAKMIASIPGLRQAV